MINLDLEPSTWGQWSPAAAALAMGAVEEARADMADETNLNPRLILERLFLQLSALAGSPGARGALATMAGPPE